MRLSSPVSDAGRLSTPSRFVIMGGQDKPGHDDKHEITANYLGSAPNRREKGAVKPRVRPLEP